MGASQWIEFSSVATDAKSAFNDARQAVFSTKRYYGASTGAPAASIAEAVRRADEEGTHSILDMSRIDTDPGRSGPYADYGLARKLTTSELQKMFATDRPTRAQVDANRHVLECERGTGRYFLVYQADQPHEYCFFGVSGD